MAKMKHKFSYLLLAVGLFMLFLAAACEKDDICAATTATTPRLIIGFYDAADPETKKAVTSLRVLGVRADSDTLLIDSDRTDRDSIIVPLRTQDMVTAYKLILNSGDDETTMEETGNTDILTINYTPNDVFVSRACGFKTTYDLTSFEVADDGDTWIAATPAIEIINELVENEFTAHVKIFH